MLVVREHYIKKIEQYLNKKVIKIITGMRRVGKSTILLTLKNELLERGAGEKDIVWINKESLEFSFIKDHEDLYRYVKQEFSSGDDNKYLFVDEVQEIKNWEKAIISIFSDNLADVIISGSNAHMLSSELATYLSGRYIEIEVYPLSFSEFLLFEEKRGISKEEKFQEYLRFGGLPGIFMFESDEPIYDYLNSIINTVILKDVVQKNNIRDVHLLERIILYLMDNCGNITSAKNISDFLKSQRTRVSVDTIQNYIYFLESAFLFHRVKRYDLKGKKILEYLDKLYMGDIGLRNGFLGYRDKDIAGILENIVFLEMKKRGYKVEIGALNGNEIDFVAEKKGERKYIQVCAGLSEDKTIKREFGNLEKISDNYDKLVLSMEKYFPSDHNGITHKFLPDFLLEE